MDEAQSDIQAAAADAAAAVMATPASAATGEVRSLDGKAKAAAFFLAIGEENTAKIMRKLEVDEVRDVSQAMASLGSVEALRVQALFVEFTERLVGADASHAWLSVWCPEFGWVDFDPTNDVMPEYEHITVGWGRDYGDVSPVMGFIVGGGSHDVLVSVDVAPVATI